MRDIQPGTYVARLKPKWTSGDEKKVIALLAYFHSDIQFEMSDQERCAFELTRVLKAEGERALQSDRKIHG